MMEYCVTGKGKEASKIADQVITKMLQEYSRQLFEALIGSNDFRCY